MEKKPHSYVGFKKVCYLADGYSHKQIYVYVSLLIVINNYYFLP